MSESTPTPVVEVNDVHRTVGGVTVLDGVTLAVNPATTTVVAGPNGSGKTSLLRVLVGLDRPTTGTVTRRVPPGGRGIGYLPQALRFRPTESVAETIRTYAAFVGAETATRDLLERVGLASAADRRVGDLSGGMVRLLGVAQALCGDPDALVLDEPTSGLDPRMTERVFDVVKTVAAERAVVLSTHDLGIFDDADRIVVLDDGRVAASDTPEALYAETGAADPRGLFRALVGNGAVTQTREVAE